TVGAPRLLLRSLLMGIAHIIPILLPVGLAASGALDGVARARMIDVRLARAAAGNPLGSTPDLETRVSGTALVPGAEQRLITRTPLGPAGALDAAAPAAPAPIPVPVEEPYIPTGAATIPVL